MSRLSALKEYTFMRALHTAGFPVPAPVACSRHTVVMSLVQGTPLYQIRHLQPQQARKLYAELMALIVRLAGVGLIHGDFNEFNIMIEEHGNSEGESYLPPQTEVAAEPAAAAGGRITLRPILIDFPQMLSISHPNASTYFDRDVGCVKRYFARRYHFTSDDPGPFFADVKRRQSMMIRNKKKKKTKKKEEKEEEESEGGVGDDRRLDVEVEASGFSRKMAKELEKFMEEVGTDGIGDDGQDSVVSDESDDSCDISGHGLDSEDGNPELPLLHEVPDAGCVESGNVPSFTHEVIPPESEAEMEIPPAQLAGVSVV
ncbi:MAG: hypothetical protein L6R35_002159 [Caloplaca aegaea]|nr:MAG: hypothetical protein L6R35_002159 [Caloplaca aegaea]